MDRTARTREGGPPAPDDGARWDVPWTVVDVLVVFLGGMVLSQLLRAAFAAVLPPDALDVTAPLAGGGGVVVALVVWLLLRYPGTLGRLRGPGPWRARGPLVGVGHGLVAFVVLNLGAAGLFTLAARALGTELPPVQESLRETITDPEGAVAGLAYALAVAVLAEELLFRGLAFQALRRLGRWPAIGLSGFAFGFVHYQPDPVAWAYTFVVMSVFGIYLAWVFDRHRHLAVPLAMHLVFNALAVAAIVGSWGWG